MKNQAEKKKILLIPTMAAYLFPYPPRGAVVSISAARSERGGGGGVRREGLRYIKLSGNTSYSTNYL